MCRLAQPQPGLSTEQRTELHGKLFRVLFMDAMALIQPPSEGNEYIFHMECPFSRWCWIKASLKDNDEE